MTNRPLNVYRKLDPNDPSKIREAFVSVLDMVRAKIEAGQVASLLILMVAPDPAVSGDNAYVGSRFIVKSTHLDLVEDGFKEALAALEKQYGLTAKDLRADRKRAPEQRVMPKDAGNRDRLWPAFNRWADQNGITTLEEDWRPWWKCFTAGSWAEFDLQDRSDLDD